MVTVYEPYFEGDYEWAMPVDNTGQIHDLRDRKRGDPWQPLWMYLVHSDAPEMGGAPLRDAGMPYHGRSVLVLKKRAREVLGPLLATDAEILPCECDEADEMALAHPWGIVDALDVEHSRVRRFTSGRIMQVDSYAFWEEKVAGLGASEC
jgi:hypothetical protein